ncbi:MULTISPECIES: DUF3017 domain-containing protein [unclassified Streptomyces]|uniref:DUF3017 domain-containing protein n=1 Tax=unclassified Streptomyces TaxID=2593676 RepID=UPI002E283E0F|nr:DUF3017 domain-containing protein [Streptomyces sp. NBC_00223]
MSAETPAAPAAGPGREGREGRESREGREGRESGRAYAGRHERGRGAPRTTARPEGGGRAAGADAPAPARQWPILLVIAGAIIGLIVTATGAFRPGTLTVGASLLVGAVLRWSLTAVGMLAVRSRFTDVITYGVLGLGIVLLALMAQPDPLIRIPFLEDIIHFSVR